MDDLVDNVNIAQWFEGLWTGDTTPTSPSNDGTTGDGITDGDIGAAAASAVGNSVLPSTTTLLTGSVVVVVVLVLVLLILGKVEAL